MNIVIHQPASIIPMRVCVCVLDKFIHQPERRKSTDFFSIQVEDDAMLSAAAPPAQQEDDIKIKKQQERDRCFGFDEVKTFVSKLNFCL